MAYAVPIDDGLGIHHQELWWFTIKTLHLTDLTVNNWVLKGGSEWYWGGVVDDLALFANFRKRETKVRGNLDSEAKRNGGSDLSKCRKTGAFS